MPVLHLLNCFEGEILVGDIILPGSTIFLYYYPEQPPQVQPAKGRANFVEDALASAYHNNVRRGFQSSLRIEEDGEEIYDEVGLSLALTRMATLCQERRIAVEKAARIVAKEDGHWTTK